MLACPRCNTRYPAGTSACPADGETLIPEEAMARESEILPGTMVGEYRVEGKLGEGGFGAVYRAVHPLIGKAAAIKVLGWDFSSNPEMVSRFIAEARAVNQIHHRNIIDVFSFGKLPDGRQYYVMELLEGQSLDEHLKTKGCLSIEEAMPILRGVARALGAAHQGGIAHRDLKPENVFLVFDEDGGVQPKLIDFGIAKLLGDDGAAGHKTRTGTPMGTPYYMSPEQCRGKNVDHRTDLYSFGVLTYVLLTGQKPFDGESAMDILLKHVTETAPRLSVTLPGAPKALEDVLAALLEKDADKRPQTAAEALSAIESAVKGLPPSELQRRGDSGPERVSVVSGAAEHRSSPEAADAKTMVDPVRSDVGEPLKSGVGAPNVTLSPAARDAAAPAKSRAWVPVAVVVAALAGAAIVLFALAGGKSGNTDARTGAASATESGASAAPGPVVVPGSALPTASATATAAVSVAVTASATASANSPSPNAPGTGKTAVGAKTSAPPGTSAGGATTNNKPPPPKGNTGDLAY
ncbi:MAG: serine/threonine-protein kinase [Polyangiaceae bacterium]